MTVTYKYGYLEWIAIFIRDTHAVTLIHKLLNQFWQTACTAVAPALDQQENNKI